jgi:O-antigen/teichoic acid export membrane protein
MKFKKNLVSSVAWRGMYFVTVLLLNLLIARLLGSELSGRMYYATNFFTLIILLAGLNLETGVAFYAAQQKIALNKLNVVAIGCTVISATIAIAIIELLIQPSHLPLPGISFLLMAITYITGILLINFFTALFYAQHNYSSPNIVMASCNIILIIAGIATISKSNYNTFRNIFLQLYFWSFLAQGIFLAMLYAQKNSLKISWVFPRKNETRLIFEYSVLALFANVLFYLLYRIDYWFIQNTWRTYPFGQLESYLGNYIQVSKVGQLLLLLPAVISSAIFPSTAAGMKDQITIKMPYLTKLLLFIYLLVEVFIVVAGNWIFPFIFGASFTHMYLPFLLLLPGIAALSIVGLIAAYNAGNNKVKINTIGAAISLVVIVIGDRIFIPQYGIHGAAAVSSAGYFCYLAYMLYFFKKESNGRITEMVIPRKEDWILFKNLFLLPWK